MKKEKEIVKQFYDTFGWRKNDDGVYKDTATWLDLSSATSWYQHQCRLRTKHYLKSSGVYFLDAGSGAIPHREYLEYTSNYRWHVCVDLSITALIEARSKLGERGIYILSDLANLPFKEGAFDGAICSHALYHVPRDEQESVVVELHRVIRPNSNCVILYMWPTCLLSKIARKVNSVKLRVKGIIRKILVISFLKDCVRSRRSGQVPVNNKPLARPSLYCHAHDYQWFQQTFSKDWNIDIRSSRSFDESCMNSFVSYNSIGQLLLKMVFWCEAVFPHIFARIGRYQMIIINKK